MSSRSTGFDPNQKRASDGTWEKQRGTRPPRGTLPPPPAGTGADAWPDDAWPDDDSAQVLSPASTATPRSCLLCDNIVTDGNACPSCQETLEQLHAKYPPEDELAALQAAHDREKLQSAEDSSRSFDEEYLRAEREHAEFFEQQSECALCDQPHHAKGLCRTHYDEKRYGRTGVREGSRTPWGPAQSAEEIAPGISSVTCAGHGGYKLSPERNKMIPPSLRSSSGWYEEDTEWAKVGAIFPGELAAERPGTTPEALREYCESKIREWEPDGWEKWKGVQLQPGESRVADERAWSKAHAGDFIVVGATTAASDPTMMRVVARRPQDGAEGEFLIPKAEYTAREDLPGEFGRRGRFVVDPASHRRLPEQERSRTAPQHHLLGREELANLTQNSTQTARERFAADMSQRWRGHDGRVRTMADILTNEGVQHRTVYVSERGEAEYALVQHDGSSMRVSRATFDALEKIPDNRTEAQRLRQQMTRLDARRSKLRVARMSSDQRAQFDKLNAEYDRVHASWLEANDRESAEDLARNGSYEERARKQSERDAARERQARIAE